MRGLILAGCAALLYAVHTDLPRLAHMLADGLPTL